MNLFTSLLRRLHPASFVVGLVVQLSLVSTAQAAPFAVKIIQPANGDVINVGPAATWSVNVAAAVSGGGAGLVVVEFVGDGQSLGTRTGNPASASPINPFQLEWPNPAPGEHSLDAVVITADGTGAKSEPVSFRVVRNVDPIPAVVTIAALKKEASELGDLKTRTLLFEIRRHGGILTLPMPVFYGLGGTATEGADYLIDGVNIEVPPNGPDPTVPVLFHAVTIPAGQETATLMLVAKGDNLLEGDESVIVSLQASPLLRPFNPLADYVIGDPGNAEGVIHDRPAGTESSLVITQPHDLQTFQGPADISIEAIAEDPRSAINRVDFFANDQFIGQSAIIWDITPPAGTPIKHHLLWKGVPEGKYILTAKAKDSAGQGLVSEAVRIAVQSPVPPEGVIVTIETTDPEAAEPDPANIGIFRISRAGGDLTLPLQVLFATHGTADRGVDYDLIPESMFIPCPACDRPDIIIAGDTIEIPAGEKSVLMGVRAVPDKALEGVESAVVEILEPTPTADPAIPPPYRVGDPAAGKVAIIESNGEPPHAKLVLTDPAAGANFQAPADIHLKAVGVDPKGTLMHVDFFAGDQKIGESDIVFIQPPEPGLPLTHEFLWKAVPVGDYKLTARSVDAGGAEVISEPVLIHVLTEPPPLAYLKIISPEPGTVYPAPPDRIRIGIQGQDPGGVFKLIEVFADGIKLGDAMFCCPECDCLEPGAGKPSYFTFDWRNVPAGDHKIVVLGHSGSGLEMKSEPVLIHVLGDTPAQAFLKITAPESGTVYPAPQDRIRISLQGQDPNGVFETVEVFANGAKVGDAQFCCPECKCVAPAPGQPTPFTFDWLNVRGGTYEIVAKGRSSSGLELKSEVTRIVVREGGDLPVVTVVTKDGVALETDPADIAIFRITRTGPTTAPLTVQFEMHGTAERGVDYYLIPESMFVPCPKCGRPEIIIVGNSIDIPAGESSVSLGARAGQDDLAEGPETLVVEITSPPVIAIPGARPPYLVGTPAEARAVILEKSGPPPTPAHIVINHPANGATFKAPATVEITATAVDPAGYMPHVEFLSGENVIGVSDIEFVRAPDPGTPIQHSFTWNKVPAGEYKLRVRGPDSTGQIVISEPVRIVVSDAPEGVIVTVAATDPEAVEAGANREHPNHGVFTLTRTGSTRLPLRVLYTVGGTAGNGTDYAKLPGHATIPAGAHTRRITVLALADDAVEGDETVELSLADGDGYEVGDPAAAKVVIKDAGKPDGHAPRLSITAPTNGQHFKAPADITVEAVAVDPDGYISHVEFFANGKSIGDSTINFLVAPDPGTPITHTLAWKSVPVGEYKLTAHCVDATGLEATSDAVKIVVDEPEPPHGFVVRDLPDVYEPGVKFVVSLMATPGADVTSYGVEDVPPKGWTVGAISHDGGFDAASGKVKFGPFLDHEARTLTYELTPPADAHGTGEFDGVASADGINSRISGDRLLPAVQRHPADLSPADDRLSMSEVTAYSTAWKSGGTWPNDPNPIPVAYVTRAGALWRGGEVYVFDPSAGPAPLWWVNPAVTPVVAKASPPLAGASVALREYSAAPDGSWNVSIRVLTRPGVASFAVEERLPDSASAGQVTEDGTFEAKAGVIRWGPFTDGEARTLAYVLHRDSPLASPESLHGVASFDGANAAILRTGSPGEDAGAAPHGPHLVDVSPVGDDVVQLTLEGEPDAPGYDLEVSSDLKTWTKSGEFLPGDFSYFSLDTRPPGDGSRFYRAVRKP